MKTLEERPEWESGPSKSSFEPKVGASRVLPAVAGVLSIASIMAVPVSYMVTTLTWDSNRASWPYYGTVGIVASLILGLAGVIVAAWVMRASYQTGNWTWVLRLAVWAFFWDLFSIAVLLFLAYAFSGWF